MSFTVLFANPRSANDADMVACANRARAHLSPGTQMVLGRDDYEATFRSFGSVKRWAESVALRYDGLVVMPVDGVAAVGSATADILEHVFARGKPVLVVGQTVWTARYVDRTTGRARDGWQVMP